MDKVKEWLAYTQWISPEVLWAFECLFLCVPEIPRVLSAIVLRVLSSRSSSRSVILLWLTVSKRKERVSLGRSSGGLGGRNFSRNPQKRSPNIPWVPVLVTSPWRNKCRAKRKIQKLRESLFLESQSLRVVVPLNQYSRVREGRGVGGRWSVVSSPALLSSSQFLFSGTQRVSSFGILVHGKLETWIFMRMTPVFKK